jgi:hypothetical protein
VLTIIDGWRWDGKTASYRLHLGTGLPGQTFPAAKAAFAFWTFARRHVETTSLLLATKRSLSAQLARPLIPYKPTFIGTLWNTFGCAVFVLVQGRIFIRDKGRNHDQAHPGFSRDIGSYNRGVDCNIVLRTDAEAEHQQGHR